MSILNDKTSILKSALAFFLISVFLFVFQFIYNLFAHGVSSNYMNFAFLIPLVLGVGKSLLFFIIPAPNYLDNQIWNMGITTLVVGSLIRGIFDIYGTTQRMVTIFFILGTVLLITALVLYLLRFKKSKPSSLNE